MEAAVSLNLAFPSTIETPQNQASWLKREMPYRISPANTLLKYILIRNTWYSQSLVLPPQCVVHHNAQKDAGELERCVES